jgi:hypothetical protein
LVDSESCEAFVSPIVCQLGTSDRCPMSSRSTSVSLSAPSVHFLRIALIEAADKVLDSQAGSEFRRGCHKIVKSLSRFEDSFAANTANIPANGHSLPTRGPNGFPLPNPTQDWRRWDGGSLRGRRPPAGSARCAKVSSRRTCQCPASIREIPPGGPCGVRTESSNICNRLRRRMRGGKYHFAGGSKMLRSGMLGQKYELFS